MRIAAQAHCRYVLWLEDRDGINKRTHIVHPRHLHEGTGVVEASCIGYDHGWLVDQIRRAHGL